MKRDRLQWFAIGFLLVEAGGAICWWLMLWLLPQSRRFFLPPRIPETVLWALALPDALLFIGAALVAAWGLWREKSWAMAALWIHFGAVLYATLFAIALAWLGNGGFLGAVLMSLCAFALMILIALLQIEKRNRNSSV